MGKHDQRLNQCLALLSTDRPNGVDGVDRKFPCARYRVRWQTTQVCQRVRHTDQTPSYLTKLTALPIEMKTMKFLSGLHRELLDLDELPIPTNPVQQELVYVEIARGCYGRCRYCPEVHRMRFKSAERAAEEIQHWYTRGYKYFYLGGANSIADGALLAELLREMEKRELRIKIFLVGRPSDVLRNHNILKEFLQAPSSLCTPSRLGLKRILNACLTCWGVA